MNIWQLLEIEPTNDLTIIKLAYSKKIKLYKPEKDPENFKQLRQAYELAQKYAAGLDVSIELNSADPNDASVSEKDYKKNLFTDPNNAGNHFLDELLRSESSALAFLNELKESKALDNLEYSELFQQNLAINLLAFTPRYYHCICHLIDYFDWPSQLQTKKDNSFYSLAIKNLINNTHPHFFLQRLHFLSQIKSKKEAIKHNVTWDECYAANKLCNPINLFKFYAIALFRKNKVKEILTLHNYIENNFPQVIGLGLSLSSFTRWHHYKIGELKNNLFNFFILSSLAVIVIIACFDMSKPLSNSNIKPLGVLEDTGESSVMNKPGVSPRLIVIHIKPVNTATIENYISEDNFLSENNFPNMQLAPSTLVSLEDNTYPTNAEFNQFLRNHKISIGNILKNELAKKLNQLPLSQEEKNIARQLIFNINVYQYGLSPYKNNKGDMKALLKIGLTITKNKITIVKNLYYDYSFNPTPPHFEWSLIKRSPTVLEQLWTSAAEYISNEAVDEVKENMFTRLQ